MNTPVPAMLNELAEDRSAVSAGEPPAASDTPVLSVRNMNVRFTTEGGDVQAVRAFGVLKGHHQFAGRRNVAG